MRQGRNAGRKHGREGEGGINEEYREILSSSYPLFLNNPQLPHF